MLFSEILVKLFLRFNIGPKLLFTNVGCTSIQGGYYWIVYWKAVECYQEQKQGCLSPNETLSQTKATLLQTLSVQFRQIHCKHCLSCVSSMWSCWGILSWLLVRVQETVRLMSCEVNPINPSIHTAVTWLLWLIFMARGPLEAITGPFTTLTRRVTSPVPALRGFLSLDVLVHLWWLCTWTWLMPCFFVAFLLQR